MGSFVVVVVVMMVTIMVMVNSLDFNYHDQAAVKQILTNLTDKYPDISYMHSIGKSVKGADLWVIVIGENASNHVTLRPHVKYIANMHGNEVVGRELLLHLAELLLDNYGVNETISNFLKTTTVHIMPTMNPDGFKISAEGDCAGVTGRFNGNNADLNRNFPDFFKENTATIQPETQAVMTWLHEQQFVISANLHGGTLVVNFPFDNNKDGQTKYSESPDDKLFQHLSLAYSNQHPTMHLGLRCFNKSDERSFKDGITNGAHWYPVQGGMQDYNYLFVGCMEVTMELSCCKYPMRSELPDFWEANQEPLITYLQQAHMGVKGLVRDENNNSIAGASVSVRGREQVVYKTTKHGEYWRLLLPGEHSLKISAPGYYDLIKPFSVTSGAVTRLDVILFPDPLYPNSGTGASSAWTLSTIVTLFLVMVIPRIQVQ